MMVRHPTQFDATVRQSTVATPTCCCCCCCLTTIVAASTMSGVVAHRNAMARGIAGVGPTLLAAAAFPVAALALVGMAVLTGGSIIAVGAGLLVWIAMLRTGWSTAGRQSNASLIALTIVLAVIASGLEIYGTVYLAFFALPSGTSNGLGFLLVYAALAIGIGGTVGVFLGRAFSRPVFYGAPQGYAALYPPYPPGYAPPGYPVPPGYPAPPGYPQGPAYPPPGYSVPPATQAGYPEPHHPPPDPNAPPPAPIPPPDGGSPPGDARD